MTKRIISLLFVILFSFILLTSCSKDKLLYNKYDFNLDDYIKLANYKGIPINTIKYELNEDEVEKQILYCRAKYAVATLDENRMIETTDKVVIDMDGYVDGVRNNSLSARSYEIVIGTESIIDGFDELLIGAKAGEEIKKTLKFPDVDYTNPSLCGKDIEFIITIKSVYVLELPIYNDEFVQKYFNCETTDVFKQYIINSLISNYESLNNSNMTKQCWDYLMGNCVFKKYPLDYIKSYNEGLMSMYSYYASQKGMSLEEYAINELLYTSMNAFNADVESEAEYITKQDMIMYSIARKEKITISDDEYDSSVLTYAKNFGYESVGDFEADYDKLEIKELMLGDKIVSKLLEWADKK